MTTTITQLPIPVPSRTDPVNFSQRADNYLGAQPQMVTEINTLASELTALGTQVSSNTSLAMSAATNAQASAFAAAGSANTAALSIGAVAWTSGTTYNIGQIVYSPITQKVYRRKVTGNGTTDPSIDTTNWAVVIATDLEFSGTLSGNSSGFEVNPLNRLKLGGQVYNYYWVQTNGPAQQYKIATLPATNAGTYDELVIEGVLDGSWNSTSKHLFKLVASNRSGLTVKYLQGPPLNEASHIDFYFESDGSVSVWVSLDAGTYSTAAVNITTAILVTTYPSPVNSSPTGSLVWTTLTHAPAMINDASGNVSFGSNVKPWKISRSISLNKDSDTSGPSIFSIGGSSNSFYGNNIYFDTDFKRVAFTPSEVTLYQQQSGQHRWYSAPSGPSDSTVSLSLDMGLDFNGLWIGGSNHIDGARLSVDNGDIVSRGGTTKVKLSPLGSIGSVGTTSPHAFRVLTNNVEISRWHLSGNLSVGDTADVGSRLQVKGSPASTVAQFYGNDGANVCSDININRTGTCNASVAGRMPWIQFNTDSAVYGNSNASAIGGLGDEINLWTYSSGAWNKKASITTSAITFAGLVSVTGNLNTAGTVTSNAIVTGDLVSNGNLSASTATVTGTCNVSGVTTIDDNVHITGGISFSLTTPSCSIDLGSRTDAIKLPSGTTAQRPSTPAEGMIRKNSTLNMLEFYSEGVWKNLSSPVGRNLLINGGFDVSQRLVNDSPFIKSTTIGLGTGLERPLFDRWILQSSASGAFNVSVASAKQSGLNVPGIDRMAILRKVGAGSQTCMLSQRIENGHNFQFINGQTFTLSFWAKSSAASDTIGLQIFEPNATNNTWSSVATTPDTTSIFSSNAATTTSWQRYSFTFDTASVNGARGMMVTFYHISSVDAEELYIAGVQLEEGAYSTNYEIKSKEQILKECERYFCTFSSAVGTCLSADTAAVSYQFRTPMMATPNTIAGQNIYWWSGASANVASPSVGSITGTGNRFGGAVGYSAGTGPWGGFTTGAALVLSGTQIIKFEAEL